MTLIGQSERATQNRVSAGTSRLGPQSPAPIPDPGLGALHTPVEHPIE